MNNNYGSRNQSGSVSADNFMTRVFGWQAAGLFLSAMIAVLVANTPELITVLMQNKFLFYGLMIAQFGAVIALSGFADKMSYSTMVAVFLGYAALTGTTLSVIFLLYTMSSIAMCFGIAASMFGVMAIYGYTTNADLSKMGSILFMGLIGIVIASLVNMFFQSSMASYVISWISVVIFTGLTAYDVQKIKSMAMSSVYGESPTEEFLSKMSILGALTLYLDLLNLFLSLLNLFGDRRR